MLASSDIFLPSKSIRLPRVTPYWSYIGYSLGDLPVTCQQHIAGYTRRTHNCAGDDCSEADSGAKDFKFVGGHPSLDFVNTVGGWIPGLERRTAQDYEDISVRDKLISYSDLVAWSKHAGLLSEKDAKQLLRVAETRPKPADAVIRRGRTLRAALYRLFKSVMENRRPEKADLECLNEELRIAREHQRLVSSKKRLGWNWDDTNEALDRVLWPLALSGAELLTSADLTRLRQCGSEKCGWLFLDTSRNRSRHWCKMSDCGNLAKVRRFRRRLAKASADDPNVELTP